MDTGLTITIDWPYALGIMGALLGISWYAGGRFSKIETSLSAISTRIKDMKDAIDQRIDDLKTDVSNTRVGAFESNSPISLTEKGKKILIDSGIGDYIDDNKDALLVLCDPKKETNPYEVQEHVFAMFGDYEFGEDVEDKLKRYAYNAGVSMDIIRRVGAIYFRDICLTEFGMDMAELDKEG